MLPASSDGNTITLAWPSMMLPGAFSAATSGSTAASNCNSPSASRSGARSRTRAAARRTISARGCSALPLVENDSRATRGSCLSRLRAWFAEARAMSARASAVGSGTTAQSAKTNCRSLSGETIRKKLEMVRMPALRGTIFSPVRMTSAVVERFPATPTSTSPRRTIMAAAASGPCTVSRACSAEMGLPASLRRAAKASAFRASRAGLAWSTTTKPAVRNVASRSLSWTAKGDCTRTGSARRSFFSCAAASNTRGSRLSGKTTVPGCLRQASMHCSRMFTRRPLRPGSVDAVDAGDPDPRRRAVDDLGPFREVHHVAGPGRQGLAADGQLELALDHDADLGELHRPAEGGLLPVHEPAGQLVFFPAADGVRHQGLSFHRHRAGAAFQQPRPADEAHPVHAGYGPARFRRGGCRAAAEPCGHHLAHQPLQLARGDPRAQPRFHQGADLADDRVVRGWLGLSGRGRRRGGGTRAFVEQDAQLSRLVAGARRDDAFPGSG